MDGWQLVLMVVVMIISKRERDTNWGHSGKVWLWSLIVACLVGWSAIWPMVSTVTSTHKQQLNCFQSDPKETHQDRHPNECWRWWDATIHDRCVWLAHIYPSSESSVTQLGHLDTPPAHMSHYMGIYGYRKEHWLNRNISASCFIESVGRPIV